MALLWFNIKSKEVRVATSEPMISAFYNSSDLGPNARNNQDFGWRIHPEVVIKMKGIKSDPRTLESIAMRRGAPLGDIDDKAILSYISDMDHQASVQDRTLEDFEDEYRDEIRRLEMQSMMTTTPVVDDLNLNVSDEPEVKSKK